MLNAMTECVCVAKILTFVVGVIVERSQTLNTMFVHHSLNACLSVMLKFKQKQTAEQIQQIPSTDSKQTSYVQRTK
jgi:hypothetical protein